MTTLSEKIVTACFERIEADGGVAHRSSLVEVVEREIAANGRLDMEAETAMREWERERQRVRNELSGDAAYEHFINFKR
jgi:Ni,Fe-hydrogenase III large subunit